MDKVFVPFSDRYKEIDQSLIFGNRSFLNENESTIANEMNFFEEALPLWVAYYRKFPHIFIKDFFGIELKPFQIYVLYMALNKPNLLIIGSRGIGKTWIIALACIVKGILYPNIKIVVVAGVKSQAFQVLAKIKEIRSMARVDLLQFEIEEFRESMNTQMENVLFFGGAYIKVVASSDNSRGHRANMLILDEFRMIDELVYTSVLRRFLTTPRVMPYLSNPKYKHLIGKERNQEIFITSAWYKNSWAYGKYKTFFSNVCELGINSTYSILSFSYEMAIMNGLLNKEQLLEELNEEGFDFATFAMELKSYWSGEIANGYFTYDKLLNCRTLKFPEYPKYCQKELNDKDFTFERKHGEVRIVIGDIALMGGKKNDNTILGIIVAYPNQSNQYYIRELRYLEKISGGVAIETHSTRIRELYEEYECDYIVLDTNGIGMQVFGDLVREMDMEKTGDVLPPLGCMNDEEMQLLVSDKTAPKVIYSFKGSTELNKSANSNLQSKIIRKHIRLLVDEIIGDEILSENKKYPEWRKGSGDMLKVLLNPYKQTTLLINEMINLELVDQENIKLKEQSGQRKDRFSCVVMGNYFISEELEKKLKNKAENNWGAYKASSRATNYRKYN